MKKKTEKAGLIEIFSSMQGEGLFLGAKQIFVRFAGCNLTCSFCDTPKKAVMKGLNTEEILKKIKDLEQKKGEHHSVSLTGGEPLLHTDFLKNLLPKLKRAGFKIYLETNGTLPEKLAEIIKYIDFIAMDFKLPSSTRVPALWEKHAKFLEIARKKNVFVKAVVTDDTSEDDILRTMGLIKKADSRILLILQPVTTKQGGISAAAENRISGYLRLAGRDLENVRIIPQMHKVMGIR
ncbi:MAG: 7-carboxy-7-deazaguanine synthase QueE [Candidatus Omnitrophota bacterium]|nr:7-carboxy-7-deazaguanine synthase QueE [Candidatus Omnitrophota bacterium]